MEGTEQLSHALVLLGQRILESDTEESLGVAKALLLEVDESHFRSMFDRWGCKTFSSLRHALDHYYLTNHRERIRWDSPVVTAYRDDFVESCLFILDLALRAERSDFIEAIIALDQESQRTLKPFVEAVTDRDSLVERAEGQRRDDGVLELLEENQRLKRLCEELAHKWQELKAEHEELRAIHERTSEELNLLKQDHQLLNEIGGSATVEEALEKIRRDFSDYERLLERTKKELEEKKISLAQREDDLRTLDANFKAQRNMEKQQKLDQAHQIIKNLEDALQAARSQEEETRSELEIARYTLREKEGQIEILKARVSSLESQAQKLASLRKLHNQYRERIMREFKEGKE